MTSLYPTFNSKDSFLSWCRNLPRANENNLAAHDAREANLTKPAGSLGRLEELSRWLTCWQGRSKPSTDNITMAIFAADHGVVAEGVSAFPQDVTHQMVANFSSGGAAICCLSKIHSINLMVYPLNVGQPDGNILHENALSEDMTLTYLAKGYEALHDNPDLICLGEMGIGNTTIAAAIYYALWGGHPADWAGPGTGLAPSGVAHKAEVIGRARNRLGKISDPFALLSGLGGAEIAAMLGALLGAREKRIPVILDGFVTTTAAALAQAIRPDLADHCLAAHCSAETAHRAALSRLGLKPLLDLNLRLGEGSGAALAVPLVRSAAAYFNGMATFTEASVATKL